MTELLTAAQMRAIEQAAIDSGEVTGLELMERAGRGVVEAIFEEWPELNHSEPWRELHEADDQSSEDLSEQEFPPAKRAVVLCGPGNNGGDGYVIARLLKELDWDVDVYAYGDTKLLPSDALVNHDRWKSIGVVNDIFQCAETRLTEGHNKKTRTWSVPPLETWDGRLLVDALFGTGVDRPAKEDVREVVRQIELMSGSERRVAVDMPSWLHADTGVFVDFASCELKKTWEAIQFVPIEAHLTVTFHRAKRGHKLREGLTACGKVVVKDIGL